MTDAPIPMETAEAIVIAERLMIGLTAREQRALEVLIRHARRSRSASVSQADTLAELVRCREHVDAALRLVTDVIGRAGTSPGGGS